MIIIMIQQKNPHTLPNKCHVNDNPSDPNNLFLRYQCKKYIQHSQRKRE
jgi:hypothetical protein